MISFQYILHHVLRVKWLFDLTWSWSSIILEDRGERILLDNILHQSLIYIIDILIITADLAEIEIAQLAQHSVEKRHFWVVFVDDERKPEFQISHIIYIMKNEYIRIWLEKWYEDDLRLSVDFTHSFDFLQAFHVNVEAFNQMWYKFAAQIKPSSRIVFRQRCPQQHQLITERLLVIKESWIFSLYVIPIEQELLKPLLLEYVLFIIDGWFVNETSLMLIHEIQIITAELLPDYDLF